MYAKLDGIEDEKKLVHRVVEIWGFFWDQVLPYVEGVSPPTRELPHIHLIFVAGATPVANRPNALLPLSHAQDKTLISRS